MLYKYIWRATLSRPAEPCAESQTYTLNGMKDELKKVPKSDHSLWNVSEWLCQAQLLSTSASTIHTKAMENGYEKSRYRCCRKRAVFWSAPLNAGCLCSFNANSAQELMGVFCLYHKRPCNNRGGPTRSIARWGDKSREDDGCSTPIFRISTLHQQLPPTIQTRQTKDSAWGLFWQKTQV